MRRIKVHGFFFLKYYILRDESISKRVSRAAHHNPNNISVRYRCNAKHVVFFSPAHIMSLINWNKCLKWSKTVGKKKKKRSSLIQPYEQ